MCNARNGPPHQGWTDEEAPEVQQVWQDRLGPQVGASQEEGHAEEVGEDIGTEVDNEEWQARQGQAWQEGQEGRCGRGGGGRRLNDLQSISGWSCLFEQIFYGLDIGISQGRDISRSGNRRSDVGHDWFERSIRQFQPVL